MKAETAKLIDGMAANAITLTLNHGERIREEEHLKSFERFEKTGVFKYFNPATLINLRIQRTQMRMARQLEKAKLS